MNSTPHFTINFLTVLITLKDDAPHLFTLNHGNENSVRPLDTDHYSLQKGLHDWAEKKSGCTIGHLEQLYTLADHPRLQTHEQLIYVSYLGLTKESVEKKHKLHSLYQYFPWEDRRNYHNNAQLKKLRTHIIQWAGNNQERLNRAIPAFGLNDLPWDDEKVLDRYELLWESGFVAKRPINSLSGKEHTDHSFDNRRILATALSRLRAKIRYTPIVFNLLPNAFTLLQLQQAMEILSGRPMHKPNFRRLVLHQKLLKETGERDYTTPGRPAKLYRFRPAATTACYLSGAMLPLD